MNGLHHLLEATSLDKTYANISKESWEKVKRLFPNLEFIPYKEGRTAMELGYDPKGSGGVMHRGEHVITYVPETKLIFSSLSIPGLTAA